MSDSWKPIAALLLCIAGFIGMWSSRPIQREPGVLAPDEPLQQATHEQPFAFEGYEIAPQATYDIEARVLSVEDYMMDAGAKLAPVDFAVGWGPMSDTTVLNHFKVDQGARFFTIYPDEQAIDLNTALLHSANMHLIPANDTVKHQLKRIKAGNIVDLHGLLVNVSRSDGFTWHSSLTRNDTGNGACELMYVEAVEYR
ncbi:MAG: hypothetical protein ABUS47_00355 [Steroidobacter sp.]